MMTLFWLGKNLFNKNNRNINAVGQKTAVYI